jgi:hypothetical protein
MKTDPAWPEWVAICVAAYFGFVVLRFNFHLGLRGGSSPFEVIHDVFGSLWMLVHYLIIFVLPIWLVARAIDFVTLGPQRRRKAQNLS